MYQALYRKYRPRTFDDVVGQKYVIETLKNEILNDKINHAYMFFGPRGIGKTTIAKIFARAVNCEDSIDGSPCEECRKCISSREKECVDIIEIDAASNNGVDEIREIRNKVNLVPAELKYKVYIIDEVHMLTQGAFNALLKTLEEPPKHVIFVLATTDPQKVSDTIISRCQCFSFKRISEQENFDRLKEVCKKENIEVSDDVLKEVSLYSDGGLRDSLGMLDKLSSYKNTNISIDDFYEMNDMIDSKSINTLCKNILSGNIASVIEQLENYNNCGKNIIEVINQLLYFLKDKVVSYYMGKENIDNVSEFEKLLQYINEKMFDIKKTSKPFIFVEIIILEFMNNNKNISREIFLDRKDDEVFEQKIEISTKTVETNEFKKLNEESEELKQEIFNRKNVEMTDLKKVLDNSVDKLEQLKELMRIRVNNTLAEASKEEKVKDLGLINSLNDYVFDPDKGYIVSEILNGSLCASSKNSFILSYEYASVVSQNLENIDNFISVYNELTNSSKSIAIITNEEWNKEKNKYIEFTKQGNKYKIIEEPKIKFDEENFEESSNEFSSAVELFGDIVEIK